MAPDWVDNAAAGCRRGGCQFGQAGTLLAAARTIVENGRRSNMSSALWCDQGGHAFSERDPGRQRISITVLDENEEEKQEARDFCGDCAQAAGLLNKRRTRPAAPALAMDAPTSEPRHADPQRIHQLESQLGMAPGE